MTDTPTKRKGRRPLPPECKKDCVLGVRVTRAEADSVERKAIKLRLSVDALLRKSLSNLFSV